MASRSPVDQFTAALARAFAWTPPKGEKFNEQLDFDRRYPGLFKTEYDTAVRVASRAKDTEVLRKLLKTYLDLFSKHAANRYVVRYHRSDQVLFELFERCAKLSTPKRNTLAEWTGQIKNPKPNRLKERFEALNPTYQSKILALIPAAPPPKVRTLLDYLREEYLKQQTYAPGSNDSLYDFDPRPGGSLKRELDAQIAVIQKAWGSSATGNQDLQRVMLHAYLDVYRKYLAAVATRGLMDLFQVIKYLQDRLITKRETRGNGTYRTDGDRTPLTCELYAMACLQLLVHAQGKLVLPTNRKGFTPEEQAYFLKPLQDPTYEYISDIADRFERTLGSVEEAFGLSKSFLDLILLTGNQLKGVTLVNLAETLRVQGTWKAIHALKEKIKDADESGLAQLATDGNKQVAQQLLDILALEKPIRGRDLESATARVGASPGVHKLFGRVTIVHMDARNLDHFYVEFEALRPRVFHANTAFITDKVYGSRILEIHKSTVGMVHVINGMFVAMGFMPALVEAGFAGLIREVLIFYAGGKLEEQGAKIHPAFGTILSIAADVVMPRAHGPKVVEPVPTRVAGDAVQVVEHKAGAALGASPTAQFDESWFDWAAAHMAAEQRAVKTASTTHVAAEQRSLPIAAPTPVATPSRPVAQGMQQQQTKRPPEMDPTVADAPSATATPRPMQQGQQPVGVRIEQPEASNTGVVNRASGDRTLNRATERPLRGGRQETPALSEEQLELAEDLVAVAEHFEAGLRSPKTKDPRYPNLEADKTVAFSEETGFPVFSGPGRRGTSGTGFLQMQSRGQSVAERDHAAHGVTRYEQLSGHSAPANGQDSFGVRGSYYAHHAEVKDRIFQIDTGHNGMTAVSKPMCPHCRLWHQRVAHQQKMTLLVADPIYVRRFNADGSVDIFYNLGFPDVARLGKPAARVQMGTRPTMDSLYDGSAW
jgi:hypothetical protein